MDRVRIKQNVRPSTEHKPQAKTAPESGAANMQQTLANPEVATPGDVLALQQAAGNSAVAGWMQQSAPAGGPLGADFSTSVAKARGSGAPLPPVLREEMAHSLGNEFGSVRVHTDEQADTLAERIQARAFTSGPDIFFRRGAYDPNTPGGKQVLKHELAHVVQQGGAAASQLTLGPVNDVHEQEAERLSTEHPLASQPSTTTPAGAVQRFFFPWQKQKMKKLGGSANTVYQVKHREGNTGYLKPNADYDQGMGARSVLSANIDQSLGTNALANETYQNYGPGMEGAESSEVQGNEITNPEFNTPISKAEYLNGIAMKPAEFKMRKSGPFGLRKKYFKASGTKYNTHDFSHPATQKGLSNIQLNDAITGQNDRHGGNIKINPLTHEPKAFDNDMMDIKGSYNISRMKGLHKPEGVGALSAEQEAVRQTKRQEALQNVNNKWGKLTGLPSHVDRTSAERMVGMKSSAFMADLENRNPQNMARLNENTKKELKNRYSSTRRYVKAGMAAAGLVNDPAKAAKWSSPAYQETVRKGAGMVPHIVGPGGWNQQTYNEQVSQHAGEEGNQYNSYLQRSVLNYNDVARAGGSVQNGEELHRTDNPHPALLPQTPLQGPPAPPPAAPEIAHPAPPLPVNNIAGPANDNTHPAPPLPVNNIAGPANDNTHPAPPLPVNNIAGPANDNVHRLRDFWENKAHNH